MTGRQKLPDWHVAAMQTNAAVANAKPGGRYGPPMPCRPTDHVHVGSDGECAHCGLTPAEAAAFDRDHPVT